MAKSLLSQLEKNKGTLSSVLGKSLARKVLVGNNQILDEAIKLVVSNNKNVRAGAAKIIEMVAEQDSQLLKNNLQSLLPALDAPEPQTRWMIIRTLGLCAELDPATTSKALAKAKKFLAADSGACLFNRTIFYLGCIGTLTDVHAKKVFPILADTLKKIPNQTNTVLDSFLKIAENADTKIRKQIVKIAQEYSNHSQAGIKNKANKLLKKYGEG
ncbi:HEAT repeat domain-containing protein [Patescibacteria group bacterium]|nr:HEAT repeat domain-containing protein [Patescibacteria group bacterium]